MAALTTHDPLTITHAQATELAALLSGGDEETTWHAYIDPDNRSDYTREARVTLRYAGTDPLLQGAALDCWTRDRSAQYEWSAQMHVHPLGTPYPGKYIPDTLPYNTREAFVSHINVSASKPLPRIAKELTTRLLTHYLPAYRHAMVRLQQDQAQQAADVALATELAGILGAHVEQPRHGGSDTPPAIFHKRFWPLTVDHGRVSTGRSFTMSPQQARALCALVATWTED